MDLGNLAALQAQMPLTATGYYLLDVGAKINPPLGYMFNKGEIRLQTFEERNGIIEMREKTHEDCFAAPDTSTPRDYSHIDLDLLCEDILQRLSSKTSAYMYFNTEAHHPTLRKGLGLPKSGLPSYERDFQDAPEKEILLSRAAAEDSNTDKVALVCNCKKKCTKCYTCVKNSEPYTQYCHKNDINCGNLPDTVIELTEARLVS